jgi:hypothetical protein
VAGTYAADKRDIRALAFDPAQANHVGTTGAPTSEDRQSSCFELHTSTKLRTNRRHNPPTHRSLPTTATANTTNLR